MKEDYFIVMTVLIMLNFAMHLLGEYENDVTFPVIAAILLTAVLIGLL